MYGSMPKRPLTRVGINLNFQVMKKFKKLKTIKSFEAAKLTKEQMYLATGGMRARGCTCGTKSVCDLDGTDDPN